MNDNIAQVLAQVASLNDKIVNLEERQSGLCEVQERSFGGLRQVCRRLQQIETALQTPTTLTSVGSSDEGELVDTVMVGGDE